MASYIGRRKFLAALGSAAGWPLAARTQQPGRMRRIAVLMNLTADDPEGQAGNARDLVGRPRLLLLSLLLFGVDLHRQRSLPQSSSASRCTAGAAGFLNLSQCRVRPLTYGEPRRFDTIPSQPSLQAWR